MRDPLHPGSVCVGDEELAPSRAVGVAQALEDDAAIRAGSSGVPDWSEDDAREQPNAREQRWAASTPQTWSLEEPTPKPATIAISRDWPP